MSIDNIKDEQNFPGIGMSLQEKIYYLNIIGNCKDICDTENKVGKVTQGKILEMHLKKKNNKVYFNGCLTYGPNEMHENRCIEGVLRLKENSVVVEYKITRLCIKQGPKEYRVIDEFELENETLKRKSEYDYNMINIYTDDEIEEMKGMLKCL